ncbi:hypothetical protein Agub_g3882, partial [Astrephomene gubernaculifera]
ANSLSRQARTRTLNAIHPGRLSVGRQSLDASGLRKCPTNVLSPFFTIIIYAPTYNVPPLQASICVQLRVSGLIDNIFLNNMQRLLLTLLVGVASLRLTYGEASCAQTDEELAPIYEGLNNDVKYWKDKLGARQLNSTDLTLLFSRNALPWDTNPWTDEGTGMANAEFTAVAIIDNKWYFPFREWGYDANCSRREDWCSPRMTAMQTAFNRWAQQTKFPDSIFLLDLENGGTCRTEAQCPAPILAIFGLLRTPEFASADNHRIPHGLGSILVPDTAHNSHDMKLVSKPWGEKMRKAIFRGAAHCPQFHANPFARCSRKEYTELAKGAGAGVLEMMEWDEAVGPFHADGQSWPEDYGKYMFALALEGISGCVKLEELLHVNSVVLKEWSPVVEYYMRYLRPHEHYLPILSSSPTDVLDVIRNTTVEEGQRIASNGQDFASRFLCDHAKMLYFKKALEQYKALFSDMDAYIAQRVRPLLQAKEKLGLGHTRYPRTG